MNKGDLIDKVADNADMSKADAAAALDATINEITAALRRGDKVQLTGFGTFEVRDRKARLARNPQTGQAIHVAASKAPAFKAGKSLKDLVNNR